VFWHSSAHILGEACERCYGCLLEHGPPTDDGFFYDMRMPPYGAPDHPLPEREREGASGSE
jgi:threonyl-tRNA synthetase